MRGPGSADAWNGGTCGRTSCIAVSGAVPDLIKRIVHYRVSRGMSFFADVRDWLGGWPMQFVHDRDVIDFLEKKHGFKLANIKTGEACTEFVFRRQAQSAAGSTSSASEVLLPQRVEP